MSEYEEQQEEELEVLRSIYEGDERFNELSNKCFQYKYGSEEGKSILVEISWPESYPSVLPGVNLGKLFCFAIIFHGFCSCHIS